MDCVLVHCREELVQALLDRHPFRPWNDGGILPPGLERGEALEALAKHYLGEGAHDSSKVPPEGISCDLSRKRVVAVVELRMMDLMADLERARMDAMPSQLRQALDHLAKTTAALQTACANLNPGVGGETVGRLYDVRIAAELFLARFLDEPRAMTTQKENKT